MLACLTRLGGLIVAGAVMAGAGVAGAAAGGDEGVAERDAAGKVDFTALAHVEVKGEGDVPVVLVPGLGGDWTVYEEFMERNSERYRMYAVTLPGFGGSEPPPKPEGNDFASAPWLSNAERAILRMIDERGLERPVLVGHSLGGHLVMRMGSSHPDRFRGVVNLDGFTAYPLGPAGRVPRQARGQVVRQFIAPQFENMDERAWKQLVEGGIRASVQDQAAAERYIEMGREIPRSTISRYMLELLAGDVTEDLAGHRTPLLVVAAVSDAEPDDAAKESLREQWRKDVARAPSSELVFMEDTRHFVFVDDPEGTDRIVAEFIEGLEDAAADGDAVEAASE